MKKLLFAILAFAFALPAAKAQVPVMPYDSARKLIVYTEVVQVAGASQALLYHRAYEWLKKSYLRAETKIREKDSANGKLVLESEVRLVYKDKNGKELTVIDNVKYKVGIYVKDGKYKYEFWNFHTDKGGYPYPMEKYYLRDRSVKISDEYADEKLIQTHREITRLAADLKTSMSRDVVNTKEDW
ncbi:MAG: DUF4468 domain-containing protein [Bacteroidota bacterium]|nr:DUF4468 domain-containing protein [Bacteroidota bacterium]